MATTNPTITDGILIKVYVILLKSLLALNFLIPKYTAKGMDIMDANMVADVDTIIDKETMLNTSLSKDINSLMASLKPSNI